MSQLLGEAADTSLAPPLREEHELLTRISAEFLEMPGLRLTLPQAARLFSLEPARCHRVLNALVRAGRLSSDGRTFSKGAPRGGSGETSCSTR